METLNLAAFVVPVVWTLGAAYGAIISGRLLEAARGDEHARTKNGPRKILSHGTIRRYRIVFTVMLLFLFAGVISIVTVPGPYTRVINSTVFLVAELLLIYSLNRSEHERRLLLGYTDLSDRLEATEAATADRELAAHEHAVELEERADARSDRADAREDRRDAREDAHDASKQP